MSIYLAYWIFHGESSFVESVGTLCDELAWSFMFTVQVKHDFFDIWITLESVPESQIPRSFSLNTEANALFNNY